MYSGLHMHVVSLQIEDQIRRASTARLAQQAKQASRSTATASSAPRRHWVALRRGMSLRRAF
jgi:hypothetical protein